MNTLDRVVLMYNAVWPEFDWDSNDYNQNAIVETLQRWYHDGEDRYYEAGEISKGGTAIDNMYCRVICTKEKFEQRVLELNKEKQMTDWYDYEKKTAITFPPVGSEVIVNTREVSGDFWPANYQVKVIAIDGSVVVYKYQDDYYSDKFYPHVFKPLDWEKDVRKDKLIETVGKLMLDMGGVSFNVAFTKLYDLGYLKFPEEK